MAVHIRWMIRRDMPEVLAIEAKAFDRHAWSEEEFVQHLRQRNCIAMVAEHDESIVGYMIYELHRDRLTLQNFAVHYDYRRQGVGRAMVNKLAGKLDPDRRRKIELAVWERNLDAQLFFRAVGFKAVMVLANYECTGEDAYLMERHIASPSKVRIAQ